jgi:hypothetical protein
MRKRKELSHAKDEKQTEYSRALKGSCLHLRNKLMKSSSQNGWLFSSTQEEQIQSKLDQIPLV